MLDVSSRLGFVSAMIQSFNCPETQGIYEQKVSKKLPTQIQQTALRKLLMIAAAVKLDDLKVPPGNRLEALKGNRKGQHSIRINEQWRVCFVWSDNNAYNVEIVDYH